MKKTTKILSILLAVIMVVVGYLSFVAEKYISNHPINRMYELSTLVQNNHSKFSTCYLSIIDNWMMLSADNCEFAAKVFANELDILYESKVYSNSDIVDDQYMSKEINLLSPSYVRVINQNITNNFYYYSTCMLLINKYPDMVLKYLDQRVILQMNKNGYVF